MSAFSQNSCSSKECSWPEVTRSIRYIPPAHYTLRIESFSKLSEILLETGDDKYGSADFETGGYKWRMWLYPNGDKKRNGKDHISMYLEIAETNTLPRGWEVNATFKFFVYDQIRDKYLTLQDVDGKIRRFRRMKTEWGFPQLLPLTTFNDASNGYLIDDCCEFGVEVFVIKCEFKGESFSIIKEPYNSTFTWTINKFSEQTKEICYSEVFTVANREWQLEMYPKGYSAAKGTSLSFFLILHDAYMLHPGQKLYVEYKLRARDQVNGKYFEKQGKRWMSASNSLWGYLKFMPLSQLTDTSKGFIVNDTLIVEGEITFMSLIEDVS